VTQYDGRESISGSSVPSRATSNTYLSAFCRRMRMRKGAPKAVMALAHHMLTIVYQVLQQSA
jgi:hypothetical protein